jgi:hypothetical protein
MKAAPAGEPATPVKVELTGRMTASRMLEFRAVVRERAF